MFGKIVEYHSATDDRAMGSVLSIILGCVASLIGIPTLIFLTSSSWTTALYTYLGTMFALYILSGFSIYESKADRKAMMICSIIWPGALVGILGIYYPILLIMYGVEFLYSLHFKLGDVKMPKLPRFKWRRNKPLKKVRVPKVGAYRSAPEACDTCGHLLENEIHAPYEEVQKAIMKSRGTFSRGPG